MTPTEKKTVLVASGGIAKIQAAVTAAENGHEQAHARFDRDKNLHERNSDLYPKAIIK